MKPDKKKNFFPWKLYQWVALRYSLVSVVVLSVFLFAVYKKFSFSQGPALVSFSDLLLLMVSSFAITGLLFLLFVSRAIAPIETLIRKTRRLRKAPFDQDILETRPYISSGPGEWSDLEKNINKLGKAFRRKTIRLSREKTELRAIMGAVSDAIIAVDTDGEIMFYNSEMAIMFGLVDLDDNTKKLNDIIFSEDVLENLEKVFTKGHPRRFEVSLMVGDANEPTAFWVSITPLKRKNDQSLYGAVTVFHSLSAIKAADKMKTELVGNVSHELRTPLTAVKGYVGVLIEDLKDGRQEGHLEFLGIIQRNVDRLIELVTSMLDLSDLESGQELNMVPVQLGRLTEHVLEQFPSRSREIEVKIEVEQMTGDELKLEQVIRNLVQNAIRYVPEDKRIRIKWGLGPKGDIILSVKDEGPGIQKKHKDRLFERFYRVDESRSSRQGGRGIGLSLVKHIVQKHGGYVEVESEEGSGSDFICHFPATLLVLGSQSSQAKRLDSSVTPLS